MSYNILIGGAAGQGVETVSAVFEKIVKRRGFEVFSIKDYMSRVRGGHNFVQVRFGNERIRSHWDEIDCIIALNEETIENHIERLHPGGAIICDEEIEFDDARVLALPLKETAKACGNVRAFGSVAAGAALALYGIKNVGIDKIFHELFSEKTAQQNIDAVMAGSRLAAKRFDAEKEGASEKEKECARILINGNDAVALGALAAGCKFYSAYPMTPSTSIMNYLAAKMNDAKIVVEQAEDEIAAINMAVGAAYAGARSMTGTSGGGFCLMVEGLGLAGMLEVPLVIANVQRPGPVTGFPTRTEQGDLKFVISASHGEFPRMVIALRDAEDAFYQTVRAFNIADKYQIPVILLSDQFLADSLSTYEPFDFGRVKIDKHISRAEDYDDKPYRRYEITRSGISPRLIPGQRAGVTVLADSDEHDESGHITESAAVRNQMMSKRMRKLELLKEELQEPVFTGEEDCEVLLLAWGSMWGPVAEAVRLLNEKNDRKYGALVFGDIWPLPVKSLLEKAGRAKTVINVEQNATGQLASVITESTGIFCDHSILRFDGRPMSSQYIFDEVTGKE
ncbi:MAG: 2-oxoacid:acceptor oxidoreductase subunit alpha [Clostridiaceae bacterium]|nr:2-oxoacid:acceptor oxidoreductase subunit alpha [Clostridiaceae bacterium]